MYMCRARYTQTDSAEVGFGVIGYHVHCKYMYMYNIMFTYLTNTHAYTVMYGSESVDIEYFEYLHM